MLLTTDQQFVSRLTEVILENLKDENFGVKELSVLSGMSQSALNHRLHSIINKNINEFVREVRLRKALELLHNEAITASEVAFKVGFKSPAYFNKCFHEFFGYPPGKVEKKELERNDPFSISAYTLRLLNKINTRLTLNIIVNAILILFIIILIVAALVYIKNPK
jgi:AraC-like DNA-binding protein